MRWKFSYTFDMKTKLETKRMVLEEFTSEDLSLLEELDSDPEVMLHLNGGRPSTLEELQSSLERILGFYEKHSHRFGVWKAFEKSSGAYLGWFLLRPGKKEPENTSEVELGYRLKKKHWNKGYASEGARSLTEHAFRDLGVSIVWAETMFLNTGSQAVMKKIGLSFVREFVEDHLPMTDKRVVRYQVRATDWPSTSLQADSHRGSEADLEK